MEVGYLIYLLVGRVLIFFGMKFAEDNEIPLNFVKKLLSCDLCFGCWIYTGLSWILGISVLSDFNFQLGVLQAIVTGVSSSFLVHLFVLGWQGKFSVLEIR